MQKSDRSKIPKKICMWLTFKVPPFPHTPKKLFTRLLRCSKSHKYIRSLLTVTVTVPTNSG